MGRLLARSLQCHAVALVPAPMSASALRTRRPPDSNWAHAAGYFITESATLVVWKFQVELAEPTSSGLDRAPIVVEGVERDLPRLRHDGDMPEARVGKQPLEMIGIREGR
jgi:hypothetical protein